MLGEAILILLFALQSAILFFFLIGLESKAWATLVPIDAIILFHLLFAIKTVNEAFNRATQWMLYSWTLAAKLGAFYFRSFPRADDQAVLTLSNSYGFFVIVFLTPILWSLWATRASKQLFGSVIKHITVESLVFCDLALHVMLDLLDITVAFQLSASYRLIPRSHQWVYTANGVFMLIGLVLHSFSLPSWSTPYVNTRAFNRKSAARQIASNDCFLTRKHAALVSVFLLDVPLGLLRLAIWLRFPNDNGKFGFQLFMLKNLVNVAFSTFRLNQCRVAEKEQSRAMEKREDLKPIDGLAAAPSPAGGQHLAKPPGDTTAVPPGALTPSATGGPAAASVSDTQALRRVLSLVPIEQQRPASKFQMEAAIEEIEGHQRLLEAEGLKVLGQFRLPRRTPSFPVEGMGVPKVLRRVISALGAGRRYTLAQRLDNSLTLGYWRQVLLGLSLVVNWGVRIFLIGYHNKAPFAPQLFETSKFPAIFALSIGAGLHFIIYVGVAPFLDALYVALLLFMRNVSFFLSYYIASASHLMDVQSALSEINLGLPGTLQWETLGDWLWSIPVVISALTSLFYVQSAFLSRKFTFYVIQPTHRAARMLAYSQHHEARSDEYGWVSTASVLCFLTCKQHMAPMSLHEVLVGPDMIRSARLSDSMLVNDWYHWLAVAAIKVLSLAIYNNPAWVAIYVVHLLMEAIYIVVAQSVRLLSLRRFEQKALYSAITAEWRRRNLIPASHLELNYRAGETETVGEAAPDTPTAGSEEYSAVAEADVSNERGMEMLQAETEAALRHIREADEANNEDAKQIAESERGDERRRRGLLRGLGRWKPRAQSPVARGAGRRWRRGAAPAGAPEGRRPRLLESPGSGEASEPEEDEAERMSQQQAPSSGETDVSRTSITPPAAPHAKIPRPHTTRLVREPLGVEKLEAVAEVLERFRRHGFLAAPGEVTMPLRI